MATHRQGHDDSHGEEGGHAGMKGDVSLSPRAKRLLAIEELLFEKGVVSGEDVQRRVDAMETRSPADGARVVARAWVDEDYRRRLLADPKAALAELGYSLEHEAALSVLENADRVHHLVVCTLCSCYPTALLGRPPDWYKSLAYRSRAIVEPRQVMSEFGLELDDSIEVRVVDSTADLRYLVLPERPAGTENMSEEQLAELVTRDSMIGVSNPRSPESVPA